MKTVLDDLKDIAVSACDKAMELQRSASKQWRSTAICFDAVANEATTDEDRQDATQIAARARALARSLDPDMAKTLASRTR